jgi:hypothetical protein
MIQMRWHRRGGNADRMSALLTGLVTDQDFFSTLRFILVLIIESIQLGDHQLTILRTDNGSNLLAGF